VTNASDRQVFVYGASGHGKVVADILSACGIEISGFIDDDPHKSGGVYGLEIARDGAWLAKRASTVAIALGIGDNFARRSVAERCIQNGIALLTAIHPRATISGSAKIAEGVVVMPHAVINADATIGQGAIINTGAIVEHDCKIGDFAHLSPKTALGGNVSVGNFSWLGLGSSVVPNIKIGKGVIVGAGATVLHDVDDWISVVGVPARFLKDLEPRF
jgi:sugar O-acyltransferase (sialic acid O-acetyltransferase NeuD family)